MPSITTTATTILTLNTDDKGKEHTDDYNESPTSNITNRNALSEVVLIRIFAPGDPRSCTLVSHIFTTKEFAWKHQLPLLVHTVRSRNAGVTWNVFTFTAMTN